MENAGRDAEGKLRAIFSCPSPNYRAGEAPLKKENDTRIRGPACLTELRVADLKQERKVLLCDGTGHLLTN